MLSAAAGYLGMVAVPGAWSRLLREGSRVRVDSDSVHTPWAHAAVRECASQRKGRRRCLSSAHFWGGREGGSWLPYGSSKPASQRGDGDSGIYHPNAHVLP